ncbi:hypothetical protein ACYDLZ_06490 [Staphylococcus succinus]
MMSEDQFHLKYKDFFKAHIPRNDNEGTLYRLLETYDDNYVILVVAMGEFEKNYNEFQNDGYCEGSFRKCLDVLYHMSNYIRMLATIEDILIKISVYAGLVSKEVETGEKIEKFETENPNGFREEYKELKLVNKGYPKLPNKHNRKTRKYRNDITHGNELMITKGMVKEKGMVFGISAQGVYDHNLKVFQKVHGEIKSDLAIIDSNRKIIESKVIKLIDVEKENI